MCKHHASGTFIYRKNLKPSYITTQNAKARNGESRSNQHYSVPSILLQRRVTTILK